VAAGEKGLTFDRVAEEYDRVRSGYPAELVDAACELGNLAAGSRVLEVGCGTGKLTTALAGRGLRVDAVEPGANMLAIARRHAGPSVTFHHARFEDVDLPAAAFDAVFSATAFHWVDPDRGWPKAAEVLRPGGMLALLTHLGATPTELDLEILGVWRSVTPEAEGWTYRTTSELFSEAEARRANVSAVWSWLTKHDLERDEASTLFRDVRITRVDREVDESAEETIALIRTQSGFLVLADAEQRRLADGLARAIDKAGGRYRATIHATLVTALRAG
jgi:ubiquinone/menaquinone biosynthesis C-methylase UbiE